MTSEEVTFQQQWIEHFSKHKGFPHWGSDSGLPHELDELKCKRCGREWARQPKAHHCPGVPILQDQGLLRTYEDLRTNLLKIKEGSVPAACLVVTGSKFLWLYETSQAQFHRFPPPSYRSYRSTLKSSFQLTDAWIKKLGEPDYEDKHPEWGTPVHLYDLNRVRDFLWDNKEAYFAFLEKRQSFIDRELVPKKQDAVLGKATGCIPLLQSHPLIPQPLLPQGEGEPDFG